MKGVGWSGTEYISDNDTLLLQDVTDFQYCEPKVEFKPTCRQVHTYSILHL